LRVQDGSALHLSGQFTEGLEGVEQHGDEKNTSTSKGARGGLRQVVETTSGNKGDGNSGEETRVQGQLVLDVEDELTLNESLDLSEEGNGVGGLFADKLPLGLGDGVPELFLSRVVSLHLLLVGLGLGLHLSEHGALEVSLGLSLGSGWGVLLVVTLGVFTLVLVGTTGQEIGSSLTGLVLPSETEHVFTSSVGRSKVDLLTLVDQEDLVELLVDTFTSLVQGDERGHFGDIGQGPDALGVIERGRGIETTRRVVPRKDTTLSTERLCDRDTFPLSTRDTTDELVSDQSSRGVLDVEHLEQGVEELFTELMLGDAAGELSGGLASEGGLDSLPDGQGGQVLVVFLAVQYLSSVLLLHLLGAQALVDDLPLDLLVTLTVVGDGLQKGRRTTTRSGEDETHLTGSQETGKVGEQVTGFGGHGVDAE